MRVALLPLLMTIGTSGPAFTAEPIARAAQAYVAAGHAEGVSIAIVRCGRSHFVQAGAASGSKPVGPDTVFEIGSLSKLFTNHLLARAVVQGTASLHDDVRRFLPPGFENLQWSDGTPVTLGHLVDTTSGLPDYLPDPTALAAVPEDRLLSEAAHLLATYSDEAFLHDLRHVQLLSRPGDKVHHSNVAAQLLGVVLSRIYHRPYATVLSEGIEAPLGMRPGTTVPDGRQAAVGHDGTGRPAPMFMGPSITPAGGLRYSARDMAMFLRQQLSNEPAVQVSHRRRATGEDGDVAFTWLISRPRPGMTRYRLTGSTFGFSSYVEVYPDLGYGIALLANRGAGDVQNELMAMAEHAFDANTAPACPRTGRTTPTG